MSAKSIIGMKSDQRFGNDHGGCAPTRGELESQIEQFKEQLLRPIIERFSNDAIVREISWAAHEAAALAWCTVCPILVLPALLEEKVRAALHRWEKQERLLDR
jgi:hypothetical protein